jgi:hypothetical protein
MSLPQAVLRIPAAAVESPVRGRATASGPSFRGRGTIAERIARLSANAIALRRRTETARRVTDTSSVGAETSETAALHQALAEIETGLAALSREAADPRAGTQGGRSCPSKRPRAACAKRSERLALVFLPRPCSAASPGPCATWRAPMGQEVDVTTRRARRAGGPGDAAGAQGPGAARPAQRAESRRREPGDPPATRQARPPSRSPSQWRPRAAGSCSASTTTGEDRT